MTENHLKYTAHAQLFSLISSQSIFPHLPPFHRGTKPALSNTVKSLPHHAARDAPCYHHLCLCVENVTELWPHHKHIFLFRFFILSDETPWPSGSVDPPHVLSESSKTNLLGLTWARQAFCWGSGTEQCQLITGWWILPPTARPPSLTARDRWRSSEVLAAMALLSQM